MGAMLKREPEKEKGLSNGSFCAIIASGGREKTSFIHISTLQKTSRPPLGGLRWNFGGFEPSLHLRTRHRRRCRRRRLPLTRCRGNCWRTKKLIEQCIINVSDHLYRREEGRSGGNCPFQPAITVFLHQTGKEQSNMMVPLNSLLFLLYAIKVEKRLRLRATKFSWL